jgi:signal transduction histidine kinase
LPVEALARELAARFHRAEGREGLAAQQIGAAIEGYRRWGARAKVAALEQEQVATGGAGPRRLAGGEALSGASLDLLALLRAAEALSAEVVLSRLAARLVEVCLSAAGAERGALLLVEDGQLRVQAAGRAGAVRAQLHDPLERSPDVAVAVIDEVRRTGEPVVLADASAHERFGLDPHVDGQQVRSVLALPIAHQGTFVGVLYLENNLATRVFVPERLRLLQLLSSHIATSLRNSQLFERLTREVDERRRAEEAVRFLAEAGSALADTLDYQETVARLAALAVPTLADWCVVHDLQDGKLRRVAAVHGDPAKQELLRELRAGPDGPVLGGDLALAALQGTPMLFQQLDPATILRFVGDAGTARVVEALGARSGMWLPLVAHGRAVGGLSLVRASADRAFGARDLALAQELGRRAAMAIDSARLYRQAQQAVEIRDEFMSIASHELRTPLSSLLLMIDGLQEDAALGDRALASRGLALVARQARRLRALADDLLDVANLQSGRLPLHPAEVDLVAVVHEVLERFAADLDRAGCSVDLHAPARLAGWWDPVRLDQVVTNLLSNAVKFAPGTAIDITVAAGDGRARFSVADRGPGIPAERLPRIFDRFERGVSADHYGGLGLGLYIVSEIARAMGGSVSVESAPGVGSRFSVDLPLRAETAI